MTQALNRLRSNRGIFSVPESQITVNPFDTSAAWPRAFALVVTPTAVAALWSAKESALKALQEGLRLDTRSVSVRPSGWAGEVDRWYPLQVHCEHGEVFDGWWQRADNLVRTMVARPKPAVPILLPRLSFARRRIRAQAGAASPR